MTFTEVVSERSICQELLNITPLQIAHTSPTPKVFIHDPFHLPTVYKTRILAKLESEGHNKSITNFTDIYRLISVTQVHNSQDL
jgi:hypothetical protein